MMRGCASKSVVLLTSALVFLLLSSAVAQEGTIQNLHMRGYVGFSYSRDMNGFITSQGLEQEVSTDLQGAFLNPNFISFGSSFSFGHSSTSLNGGSLGGVNTFAGSASVMALPASSYPLIITYQRTRVGLGSGGLDTTTNTDRLGFDWRLNFSRLPKVALRYERDNTSSDIPVDLFAAAKTHGSGYSIGLSDTVKGFDWDAGWMHSDSQSQATVFDLPTLFNQKYDIAAGNVRRNYLGGKGIFSYGFSRNTTETGYTGLTATNGVITTQSASTSLRPNSKLTTSGGFQYYTFDNKAAVPTTNDPNGDLFVVSYPASGYVGLGSVVYQLHPRIAISDSASYSVANTPATSQEQVQNYFTNTPAVTANYTWHRVRLTANYGLGYLRTGTNLDRTFGGFSNNGSVSAAWANEWVSLTGAVGIGHATTGVIPGSYTDTSNYSLTAESQKFRRIGNLRARYEIFNRTLLATTGLIDSRQTVWSLALTRKKWQVEGGANTTSGARQGFGLIPSAFQPLPPLIGVPLLNDTGHNYFITGSGRLRHNLQVHGSYRRDVNEIRINGGTATYSLYEIYADYRIGKIVINASYGHYLSVSDNANGSWGSGANRFRFRIVRTFNLF